MTEALMNRIKAQLVRHEGLRLKPYRCSAGRLTIGIGRNLDLVSTQMTQIERIFADHNSTGFKSDPCLVALLLSYLMSCLSIEEGGDGLLFSFAWDKY